MLVFYPPSSPSQRKPLSRKPLHPLNLRRLEEARGDLSRLIQLEPANREASLAVFAVLAGGGVCGEKSVKAWTLWVEGVSFDLRRLTLLTRPISFGKCSGPVGSPFVLWKFVAFPECLPKKPHIVVDQRHPNTRINALFYPYEWHHTMAWHQVWPLLTAGFKSSRRNTNICWKVPGFEGQPPLNELRNPGISQPGKRDASENQRAAEGDRRPLKGWLGGWRPLKS